MFPLLLQSVISNQMRPRRLRGGRIFKFVVGCVPLLFDMCRTDFTRGLCRDAIYSVMKLREMCTSVCRYVTRRPVRARGRSKSTWMCDATTTTTTDDDDVDQPKTGRYWTRDQRRQHVAERRQRDEARQLKRTAAVAGCSRSPMSGARPQHGLAEELATIGRHRQAPLLSVATV